MAQCVSRRCRAKVEPGWLFCAYCGTDNRPDSFRPMILACPHLFFENEGYCVRCGDCRDGRPSAAQRAVQASIGRKFMLGGFVVAGGAVGIQQIHQNHWMGNEFIIPWYDEATTVDGKPAMKGDDYISWAETGGGILFAIGVLASAVAWLNAGRRRRR